MTLTHALSLRSVCLGSDVTRVRNRGGVVVADCGVTPTGLTAIATAMVPSRGKWANALRKVRLVYRFLERVLWGWKHEHCHPFCECPGSVCVHVNACTNDWQMPGLDIIIKHC